MKINIQTINSKSLRDRKYKDVLPEYYDLEKVTENSLWHNNQNVLDHVIGVFEGLEIVLGLEGFEKIEVNFLSKYLSMKIGAISKKDALIVATLLHDIAKIDAFVKWPDGTAGCPGHELIGAGKVKKFSDRFGLDVSDESYVEKIVRYHGFISEILNLIIANKNKDKYLEIFEDTVGDVAIELILLMHADLLGSDLEKGDKSAYDNRIEVLDWMLRKLIKKHN